LLAIIFSIFRMENKWILQKNVHSSKQSILVSSQNEPKHLILKISFWKFIKDLDITVRINKKDMTK